MNHNLDLNDSEFEKQFRDGILAPSLFNHEAHLRLAWIHVSKYGVDTACKEISNQILAYVTQLGETDKFNKTLTIAAVRTVNHFLLKSKSNSFQDFITEFPRLKYNFKDLLDSHYGFDIFNSEKAKTHYVEPDLLPF
ncbi:hypothetical protein D1818_07480 [Aquimarina sp. BL5]|uniref:hypothetical protein n=1 Tax=Aquimarina sp. BL5 TaxID=1714860 RepID=UPI000E49A860|nr:hypothetical protein [Aquimarina sp. BL5]AXT50679.1 hypothetical protein D1818_07480 [Aquimarina sp. BL5]RKN00266.1 hypothetical protein D7036_19090 [Aquimarina sp. BL5]